MNMITNTLKACLAIMLIVTPAVHSYSEVVPHILTLEDAKKTAIERNPRLQARKLQVEKSRHSIGIAQAALYPKLDARLGTERTLVGVSNEFETFGYLAAVINLYRGGADSSRVLSSKLDRSKLEIEYNLEKMLLESEVEEVFSSLLFIRDNLDIKSKFIEINERQKALARQLVARGSGSESDIVAFELRDANLRSEKTQIDRDYQTTVTKFKTLIGSEFDTLPMPSGSLSHEHFLGDINSYFKENLQDSPAVRLAGLDLEISQAANVERRSKYLPRVDLEARYGDLPSSGSIKNQNASGSIAAVATWELFSGFETLHSVQEGRLESARKDSLLKWDIQSTVSNLEIKFNELMTIQKRADIEKDNVRNSKRYFDLVAADFKRGYKNSSDFAASSQAWYDAEVQRKRLDLDFKLKRLEIENILGKRIITVPMKDLSSDTGDHK